MDLLWLACWSWYTSTPIGNLTGRLLTLLYTARVQAWRQSAHVLLVHVLHTLHLRSAGPCWAVSLPLELVGLAQRLVLVIGLDQVHLGRVHFVAEKDLVPMIRWLLLAIATIRAHRAPAVDVFTLMLVLLHLLPLHLLLHLVLKDQALGLSEVALPLTNLLARIILPQ